MHIRKTVAAFVASLSLGLPFAAAAQGREPLKTSKDLLTAEMQRVGCIPEPEYIHGRHDSKTYIHNLFSNYCEQNKALIGRMDEGDTDISVLAHSGEAAILAMRAVPAGQESERNRIAQAAAIDIARAAVDFAFAAKADKNPELAKIQKDLQSILSRAPQAGQDERAEIHRQAYELRLSLEKRNFKYHYVQAAQAVAMAVSVGEPGILGEPPGVSTNQQAWVSLNRAAYAYMGTILYEAVRHPEPGRRTLSVEGYDAAKWEADRAVGGILRRHMEGPR